ncbi:glycosyltransferase family 4 protein [Patescibacteria group bacterium]|nr:glycosyltransferase family 4 protein [Patescibacteria group bacterium]MBU1705535.1 glycosyltransferase family 4 protein [Patescibacteria group bacterium]
MNILVDTRHLNEPQPSGIGEYTIQLLTALFKIDHENSYTLITVGLRRPDLSGLISDHPRVVHRHRTLPGKLINASLALFGQPTLEEIAGVKSDLIFLPNLNFVALPPGRPTVLTLHDLSFAHFPQFYSGRMRLWHRLVKPPQLVARAQHLICPSQSTRQDLNRLYRKAQSQIAVIPHGCGPEFTPAPSPRDQDLVKQYDLPSRFALFLGTLEPRKNLFALIRGLREYRSQAGDDLHLVLAGHRGWKSADFQKMIREPEYQSWIHYLNYVPGADRPGLMRLAQVFLWPSIYEGFGLPVLEAMACGLPVITSHTSSLPEITQGAAILIDPYNSRDLARALTELFASPGLPQKLSQAGLIRAHHYSWEQAARQTLSLFQKNA